MTITRLALSILAILTVLGVPSPARADDAAARQQFKKGIELYDRKQYQAALESFRAAYAEKPSPGIKQNVALCLKGLGKSVEAATAFDEALDEGADTLKPDTKAAIAHELAGLASVVGTVNLKVITKRPLENIVVSVDGAPLSPAALRRPIRLEPGIHVFTARADGVDSVPEKKLSILAGSPVDASFELPPAGVLTITPNVANAIIQVDGRQVSIYGPWSGPLDAGKHRVTVTAPGYEPANVDLSVVAGATTENPITLLQLGEGPPRYEDPNRKPPPKIKRAYLVPTLAYDGQSLRLATVLQEKAGGTKRSFTGGSIGLRAGYRPTRVFSFELQGEVGSMKDSYVLGTNQAAGESETKVIHWQLTPAVRVTTLGPIRFTAASGFGIHGLSVDADIHTLTPATPATPAMQVTTGYKGSGVSASWLADLGVQFDVGSLFLEALAFVDIHGVGTTREEKSNERMFLSSPGARGGIRVGLGIPF